MGDFNAKIGSDNQGYENVMGVHGLNRLAPQNQPDIQPAFLGRSGKKKKFQQNGKKVTLSRFPRKET